MVELREKLARLVKGRLGSIWLFSIAFAESSFFPIPPDPFLLAAGALASRRALFFGALVTIGSTLGALFGYLLGFYFFESVGAPVLEFYRLTDRYETVGELFRRYDALAILVAAVSPIPYKVFTIAGGLFKIDPGAFILASVLGRGSRFMIESFLVYRFGPTIIGVIERNMTLVGALFAIALIGGFALLTFLF